MEQHHFDIVNHATPRLESMDKALGRGKYTDDLELPNMAYAALVRCPYSHAEVLSIDVSEAEKVPGFLGCALPEETPQVYFNCSGNPLSPLLMADEKVLTTEPLTIGDRVAVVAAETEEAARAAAEAVKVEFENLAPSLDVKAALADNAPQCSRTFPTRTSSSGARCRRATSLWARKSPTSFSKTTSSRRRCSTR